MRNEYRTLASLQRLEGSNAYVMDYYGDYHLDQIRECGIDPDRVEDHLIEVRFPDLVARVVQCVKSHYLPKPTPVLPAEGHRCSAAVFRNARGEAIFGRNFDWRHNASLILRIHGDRGVESVAVIDLAYLGLDREDLDQTGILARAPLLFAPYYLMDGMNARGLAIADLSLDDTRPPHDSSKPDLLHSTAMRLVLDDAATTEEAIRLLGRYNLRFADTRCHFLIADATGDSAVVEFLDGELRVTRTDAAWQACTNHRVWNATEEELDRGCPRYRVASDRLDRLAPGSGATEVIGVMSSVAVRGWTMWTSVYNLSTGEFLFAHRKGSDRVHRVPVAFAE